MLAAKWIPEITRYILLHLRRFPAAVHLAGGSDPCPSVVVSLTTIPSRIGRILPTINSLLSQTVRPRRIFLAVPDYSLRERRAYEIPEALRSHQLVTILPSERDWGPITKLIPALRHGESAPDDPILAVDDDNIYPKRFIETFVHYARELPDAALSLRGWPIPPTFRWKDSREFKGTGIAAPVQTDVITGCGGILVRPRFFGPDFFACHEAPPQAFFNDDIWISGHLARRNVPKYVIPFAGACIYLPSRASLFGPALDKNENRTGINNDVLIEYFRSDWRFPFDGAGGR
jgi:hypothetical protein